MAKGVIEFNLPEEQFEFDLACKASVQNIVLDNIKNKIRQYLKYGHNFNSVEDVLEDLQDYFYEQINDYKIPLE